MGINKRTKSGLILLLYLSPFLAMVVIFNYVPIFGWIYAFINYKPGVPLSKSTFVGLRYFVRIFTGVGDFWPVLRNTLVISLINICLSVVPAIFAIMISQVKSRRYSSSVQTFASIPYFISWVLVFSVVFYLVGSQESGVNKLLMKLHLVPEPISILTDVNIAWGVQACIVLWKTMGYNAIIYLAAMSGIDQELYQAADVDGANNFQKILHVTVPGIIPTYFVLLMLAIANMLSNGFEQFWLFGNGLTWDALEVLDTYVYRMGIQNVEFSFAIALGIFKTIVSIVLLSVANMVSKFIRSESIF